MNAFDRLWTLSVADVMTRQVVKVSSLETMLDVSRKFVEHDVVAAPVTNQEGQCVGFFSAADFLRRELQVRQQAGKQEEVDPTSDADVSRFMSSDVRTLSPGMPLLDAARLMCEQHLHRLPVLDDRKHVVGIVSTMDVVAALVNAVDEMEASGF